jgi:hypothetical protein
VGFAAPRAAEAHHTGRGRHCKARGDLSSERRYHEGAKGTKNQRVDVRMEYRGAVFHLLRELRVFAVNFRCGWAIHRNVKSVE